MARSSLASCKSSFMRAAGTISASTRSSNQNTDSSASSMTTPILEINSALDLARQNRPVVGGYGCSCTQRLSAEHPGLLRLRQGPRHPHHAQRKALRPVSQPLPFGQSLNPPIPQSSVTGLHRRRSPPSRFSPLSSDPRRYDTPRRSGCAGRGGAWRSIRRGPDGSSSR